MKIKNQIKGLVAILAVIALVSSVQAEEKAEMVEAKAEMKGSAAEMKGSGHEMKGSAHEAKGSMGAEMSEEQAAMMAKWKAYSTPGDAHKVLEGLVGEWTHVTKSWHDPSGEPEVTEGTASVKWIMDGRYVQQTFSGSSMGMPYNGMGVAGYNNLDKEYTSFWLDNMGTGMIKGSGSFDAEAKVMTETGSFSCPMFDGTRSYRAITTFVSDDAHTYEMYMSDMEGNETKAMEISYTRVKS